MFFKNPTGIFIQASNGEYGRHEIDILSDRLHRVHKIGIRPVIYGAVLEHPGRLLWSPICYTHGFQSAIMCRVGLSSHEWNKLYGNSPILAISFHNDNLDNDSSNEISDQHTTSLITFSQTNIHTCLSLFFRNVKPVISSSWAPFTTMD